MAVVAAVQRVEAQAAPRNIGDQVLRFVMRDRGQVFPTTIPIEPRESRLRAIAAAAFPGAVSQGVGRTRMKIVCREHIDISVPVERAIEDFIDLIGHPGRGGRIAKITLGVAEFAHGSVLPSHRGPWSILPWPMVHSHGLAR